MPRTSSGTARIFYPQLTRQELVAELQARLPALAEALPLAEVVLFGSWATGRATAFSDIDLLAIYHGPPRDDAYSIIWRCLRLRGLELHVYSEGEATLLRPTLDRMTRDGVQLL